MKNGKKDKTEILIQSAKVAHMSNSRWRKLFAASEQYSTVIGGVLWKFVAWDRPIEHSLCVTDCLLDDERFGDCLPVPYAALREIEWVFIPHYYDDPREDKKRKLPRLANDLPALIQHYQGYGHFPINEINDGIKILGYER